MKTRRQFRPLLEVLEDRQCPSVTVQGDVWSNQGTADLSIVRTSGDTYQVTYGIFSKSYTADSIKVDLDGSTLDGNVQIDLGTSASAALPQSITVDNGQVNRNVFVTGLASGTSITMGGTGLLIAGNLNVTGRTDLPVAGDSLHLAGPSTVQGDLNAIGVASVSTDAATLIDGWLVDYITGAPAGPVYQESGGFNFQALGQVNSYITVQGGASSGNGLSTVVLGGTIHDDATINVAAGNAYVNSGATIVEANFDFNAGKNVNAAVILGGSVKNANVNLGGSAATASALALVGTVNGAATVAGQSGFVLVVTALPTGPGTWEAATIDGSLSVQLGKGAGLLFLDYGQGAQVHGGVSFAGSGFDREIIT